MSAGIYHKLARHLDNQPGGYPATPDGVEIRILKLLFTPEEAEFALKLNLIAEEPETLAVRAGISREKAETLLNEMASKGLVFRIRHDGKPDRFMSGQFIVGIWELQAGHLSPELAREMEIYMPYVLNGRVWQMAPQMRVIPVQKSIDHQLRVMTYEDAETLVRGKKSFVVTPCICRTEKALKGKVCKKPMETCITFGDESDFFLKTGTGRKASLEEVLDILVEADKAGLVLQPTNGKEISWICCCCGCCCALLRTIKRFPDPGKIVASPFSAVLNDEKCTDCGICLSRCQVDAIVRIDSGLFIQKERCIGCGLCVTTCPWKAISLKRKPIKEQPVIPANFAEAVLRLGWKRGKIDPLSISKIAGKSVLDRLRAKVRN